MRRYIFLALVTVVFTSSQLSAQVLTHWVESKSPQETNKIALGYPVPIPVDTPLPFDGFRTYAGLHMRHQDLVATTPWVHPEQVGSTRAGRTIWAYRLGDDDLVNSEGLPEPAMLTNGGIHAREWQTPEVVTGILELLALHENDNHFYDYLRDNVNIIVIPSLNIDGFLQTQRYPTFSYLQSDPDNPDYSPRDGRMRRKNMLSTDEVFNTTADHLNGVDLNRNNDPYWGRNISRSSPDLRSIVHRGASAASEPEIQALDAAAQLGPIDRLRMYTDVHSFSQVHFWVRNNNSRLTQQTEKVLTTFSNHHQTFPAGKYYYFSKGTSTPRNQGIGTTDEYFTFTYQVPSWTLEVEPSGGQSYHSPLPGNGADYGGTGENGHDGFILPESEIRRVREEMAQSFAAAYYRQAGPPAIKAIRVIDSETLAVVFEADWDVVDEQTRLLHSNQLQALQLNHSYDLWLSFNKPMRWRIDGEVARFPGHVRGLDIIANVLVDGSDLNTVIESDEWLNEPGGAPFGYANYEDDSINLKFSFPDDEQNRALVLEDSLATLKMLANDMTDMVTDANPATIADWKDGAWSGYENTSGNESDFGGFDSTISIQMTNQSVAPPFVLEPGMTSSWYDPSRDGEGFLLEMLKDDIAVMYWYTYDAEGAQDWYVGVGFARGNQVVLPDIYRVSGGEFGPGFDPQKITEESVGSANFIWSGCDQGSMSYQIGHQHGRMQLTRLLNLMGIECGNTQLPPVLEEGLLSGSWYDPSHNGEGFNLEVLADGRVVAYWFSFDPEGKRRWFFGIGDIRSDKLVFDDMLTSFGGIFGPEFDPDTVQFKSWGSLELDLNCLGGTASYQSIEDGFGSGTLNLVRLTNIDLLSCP